MSLLGVPSFSSFCSIYLHRPGRATSPWWTVWPSGLPHSTRRIQKVAVGLCFPLGVLPVLKPSRTKEVQRHRPSQLLSSRSVVVQPKCPRVARRIEEGVGKHESSGHRSGFQTRRMELGFCLQMSPTNLHVTMATQFTVDAPTNVV